MKKTNFFRHFVETLPAMSLLGMLLLAPMGASAQVTIGSGDLPAATLDVVATNTDGSTAEGVIVPRLTKAQINGKQAQYTAAQTGATVYVTDFSAPSVSGYSDQIGCIGFAYWNGVQWMMDCGVQRTYVLIDTQPQPFTFYELGTETELPLVVSANGSSALTYEWRKLTGSNIHVIISVPCTATDGAGFNTASFTPRVAGTLNATNTLTASKNGFYRYFVRITNATGETVDSNIAEVAVGCGAKDMNGEWISFMCNNLGASANTMATQKTSSITLIDNGSVVANTFLRSANERNLYGDLYQWGRIADGHENRNAIPVNGTGGVDATDNCVSWASTITFENGAVLGTSQVYPFQQVTRGSTFFGKFIKTTSVNNFNWYANSVTTQSNADQLWHESAFGSNDPCQKLKTDGSVPSGNVAEWYPAASGSDAGGSSGTGWRIPTQGEWASLYRGGSTAGSPANAMANTWVWYNNGNSAVTNGVKGYELKPDGVTTTLFLPAVGSRHYNNGLLYSSGAYGTYWSASVSGVSALTLGFGGNINPAAVYYRGYGFALRCIKN